MKIAQIFLISLACVGSASATSSHAVLKSYVQQRLQARSKLNSEIASEGIDFDGGFDGFIDSVLDYPKSGLAWVGEKFIDGYNWVGESSPIGCSKAGKTCDSVLYSNKLYDCGGHYAKCWKGCCCEDKKAACAIVGHIPDAIPVVAAIVGYCAATAGGCVLGAEPIIVHNAWTYSFAAPAMLEMNQTEAQQQRSRVGTQSQPMNFEEATRNGKLTSEEKARVEQVFSALSSPTVSEEELEPVVEGAAKMLSLSKDKVREVLRFVLSRAPTKAEKSCERMCVDGNRCALKVMASDSFKTRGECSAENCCSAGVTMCARECLAENKCALKSDRKNVFTTRTPCSTANCCSA